MSEYTKVWKPGQKRETAFEAKYHLEPVRMDERLEKMYGLTRKARGQHER